MIHKRLFSFSFAAASMLFPAHMGAESHHYQLAESFFNQGDYAKAADLLKPKVEKWQHLEHDQITDMIRKHFYLLALSNRAAGDYEEAALNFTRYLSSGEAAELPYYEEAQWELGFACYVLGDKEESEAHWRALLETSSQPYIVTLTRIYLARLALSEGNYEKVDELLAPLDETLPPDDSAHYEAAYLKAEAAFYLKSYSSAVSLFEKSMPQHNKTLVDWYQRALFNLGWSYLKLAEETQNDRSLQADFFSKSEASFKELISAAQGHLRERALLSLARVFALRHFYSHEEDLSAIEQLLNPAEQFENLENRIESFLIRAEAAPSYSAKEEIYRVITEEDTYKRTLAYRRTWYYRGMNDYQQATELLEKKPEEAQLLLKRAAASFEQSYQLLKELDSNLAALSLKHQSQVYFHLGTPEFQTAAVKSLQKLIDEKELFDTLEEQDEAIYSLGLMAAKLYQSEQDAAYAEIAEEALNLTVSLFPDGLFADGALYALGNMYLQSQDYESAQPIFVELAEKYPSSIYASEAWFWAGHCSEELDESEENARHFRQQVYTLYPQSAKAGEAYFRIYSFTDYLQGSKEATQHLQAMLTLFPEDPFIIVAHYLLGIDKPKALQLALASFKEAQQTFDKLFAKQMIPEEHLEYLITIRYRAMLEHALLSIALQDDDRKVALANLEEILNDFSQENHPLTSFLLEADALPRIYEESLFTLSQLYLKTGQIEKAEKALLNMLEKYQTLEIPSGYYLSRAWYQLALISMERSKYEEALRRFDQSEKCGKLGVLTAEQKLDLWIQKSHCYKALKQTHMAMLMLSHAINEKASSSLRIKAMVLRADIYAMQGRRELAIKQLEAASRKGGEWAQTAKEKLKVEYGLE